MLESVTLTEMLLFTDIKLVIQKLVSPPCLQRLVAEKLNFIPHTYYRDGTLNIAYCN
jgi:hypothetical protein